jgi:ABC-type transport system involved in cytochrome c biogenesis permease subunit
MGIFESVCFWSAVTLYAAGFTAGLIGWSMSRNRISISVRWIVAAAVVLQIAGLSYRAWMQAAPPMITYFESVVFGSMLAGLLYTAFAKKVPDATGAVLCFIVFILMGSAALKPSPYTEWAPGLQSWWLIIHVFFAMSTFGVLVLGVGASVGILQKWKPVEDPARLNRILVQCLSYCFFAQSAMVASGAVWAKKSWGRYWGLDPIECFSILAWIAYGAALHLNKTYGWRDRKLAWTVVVSLIICVYGIWGVPFFFQSAHIYEIQ